MSLATATRLGRPLMGGAFDLTGVTSADEARVAAGLAWEPIHRPLYVDLPDDQGLAHMAKERAVVRSDNYAQFGVVGDQHQSIGNADFFDFADVILREADMTWEDASPVGGALNGGRMPFLCIQLGEDVQVGGIDAVGCALLLVNGHVGNSKFRGVVNPIRLGCGNQVRASIAALGMASFSIQHSGDIAEKVVKARKGLAITGKYMREFAAMADRLADIDFSFSDFGDFVDNLLPIADDAGDRAKKTNADQKGALRLNWLRTETLTDELKRTAWGALNVVTEVIDHGDMGRKSSVPLAERRVQSIQFGTGAGLRDRAYALLGA